jgi:hypothetical protein
MCTLGLPDPYATPPGSEMMAHVIRWWRAFGQLPL